MKATEIDLATAVGNFEKLQREHNAMNDELTRCRCDLEQSEKSDLSHKERVKNVKFFIENHRSNFSLLLVNSID